MRIVIICVIVAVLSLAGIMFINNNEETVPEHAVKATQTADTAGHDHDVKPAVEPETDKPRAPTTEAVEPVVPHVEPADAGQKSHDEKVAAVSDAHQIHWGYQGEGGPDNWGKLSSDYAICGSGRNQSPINLTGFVEAELPPLTFNYAGMAVEILNNGHTVQANYHPGSNLVIDGRIFQLKQFHFHAPSENLLNGKSYPLEAHFVHADNQGNLAVVAVLFQAGEENRALSMLWDQLPQEGNSLILASQVKATDLLPDNRDYYRFNGSLTTPPCSQGVIWLVMKQTLTVSPAQVEKFSTLLGGPNNRPVQPINARMVLQ